jgi:hypothetical protein
LILACSPVKNPWVFGLRVAKKRLWISPAARQFFRQKTAKFWPPISPKNGRFRFSRRLDPEKFWQTRSPKNLGDFSLRVAETPEILAGSIAEALGILACSIVEILGLLAFQSPKAWGFWPFRSRKPGRF